ncbi:MAG: T9SS type A sorting domain-containing protein, partial [Candidatus Zixiibacteriota bacterium]
SLIAYPNPFNASTTLEYGLPEPGHVRIHIYDLLGRITETLLDEEKQAGRYQIPWDASDYSSGVYFYRIEKGDFSETRKMILLK